MSTCNILRRKFVTHSGLNPFTGVITEHGSEWKTEPCGSPLFSDAERSSGICRSCASGWTHEHNYAVNALGERISIEET